LSHKAIFLDRDGVINIEKKDYVKSIEEFEIYDGVAEAISLLKKNNFLVIVITNQSAVNRKFLSVSMLEIIHKHFKNYLKENNTLIDAIYYCPHMPNENCLCRKPKTGLLQKAVLNFNIDITKSWMIGDSNTDAKAAKSIGCNWIILKQDQTLLQVVKNLIQSEKI